jgi:hypothetical protein
MACSHIQPLSRLSVLAYIFLLNIKVSDTAQSGLLVINQPSHWLTVSLKPYENILFSSNGTPCFIM